MNTDFISRHGKIIVLTVGTAAAYAFFCYLPGETASLSFDVKDLNGNGVGDPDEDLNEDGNFDAKVHEIEVVDDLMPRLLALEPGAVLVTGDHSTPANARNQITTDRST